MGWGFACVVWEVVRVMSLLLKIHLVCALDREFFIDLSQSRKKGNRDQ
jgi:hypothetical protein